MSKAELQRVGIGVLLGLLFGTTGSELISPDRGPSSSSAPAVEPAWVSDVDSQLDGIRADLADLRTELRENLAELRGAGVLAR